MDMALVIAISVTSREIPAVITVTAIMIPAIVAITAIMIPAIVAVTAIVITAIAAIVGITAIVTISYRITVVWGWLVRYRRCFLCHLPVCISVITALGFTLGGLTIAGWERGIGLTTANRFFSKGKAWGQQSQR